MIKKYDSSEQYFFGQFGQKEESHREIKGQLLLADRLFHSMMEGVFITDTAGVIRFINPAFSTITGYGEEIIGLTPQILQSGQHEPSFYREMWQSIEQVGQWEGEVCNKRQNDELYIQWTTITRIKDDDGEPLYYASVFTDITKRKREEQQLQDDLLLAREVQKGALSKPLKNKYIDIEGVYLPSDMLGGDMYAWYPIDDHRYGIFLMDVMGHGVASALVCMSVRSLLEGIITKCIDPETVLQELNNYVFSLFRGDDSFSMKNYYLTGIYALIDTNEKTITYATAGHPPGFLFDENGRVMELDIGTVPLGILVDITVPIGQHVYSPHTKVIFYTDGIMEDEQKDTRENIEYLKRILVENRYLESDQLLTKTIETILKKENVSTFQDDATLVAVTVF